MPTYRDRGVVLRTKTLRDADRHYVIYTEHHGKIVVLAKGSRRGKSKMSPHLGSFGMVDLMVAKGRVIDRLAGAGLAESCRGIITSLSKTALAQGFLLAVDTMTKRELPDDRLFALVREFLLALDAAPEPEPGTRSLAFDAAAAKLMDLLGFGLELGECVSCRSALVPEGNAVNVARGGVECASCRDPLAATASADAIKALRFLRAEPIAAAALLRLGDRARREVGFLTDLLLTAHLEGRFTALHYLKTVA
jgi:DNA repair protein RecO (recombination protein O)